MFRRETLGRDIFAGITVALVALPLNLSLAIAAGVDPEVGLISGIVAGAVAAIFAGQRFAITGPAAAMAVVLIEIVHTYGMPGIWFAAFIAGFLQIISGFLRMGRIIAYIPMPVMVGFANAIGVLVTFNALDDLFGLRIKKLAHAAAGHMDAGGGVLANVPFVPEFVRDVTDLFERLIVHQDLNIQSLIVGLIVIVLTIITPRLTKLVPSQLVAVTTASLVAYLFHFNVPRIMDVSGTINVNIVPHLPVLPKLTDMAQFESLFLYSFTIYMLGSIESLLSASVADGMTMSSKHRPDEELIAQGLANVCMPFFGGIPVTGVIARTAVNISAGAKTRLSGLVHALVLYVFAVLVAPVVGYIPLSALAGILVLTGYRLIEWDELREIWRGSRTEAWVVIATTLGAVAVDLTAGVLIGLMLTCLIFVKQMSKLQLLTDAEAVDDRLSSAQGIPSCKFARTYLVDGPLFFGAVEKFAETILVTSDVRALILHMRAVSVLDLTGVETLLSIHSQMRRKNVRMVIAELPGQPLELLKNCGALNIIGTENYFYDYREALLDVNEKLLSSVCEGCATGLVRKKGEGKEGPRDCKLRNALLMDNNRLAKSLKARMDRSQKMLTGQYDAVSKDITRLLPVREESDIPESLRNTPVAALLKCQNFGQVDSEISDTPDMIIGMCIDYRKSLSLPQNCAYVIRREGANMAGSEFSLALALSAGIEYMALITHNHCVMSNPHDKREAFVTGLADKHGWAQSQAQEFFDQHAASREISDAIDFSLKEARRLERLFRGLKIVPMMFMLEDNMLYLVKDWLDEAEPDSEADGEDVERRQVPV